MGRENDTAVNQVNPENNNTVKEIILDVLPSYAKASVKGTLAKEEVQKALWRYVAIPELVIVKEVTSQSSARLRDAPTRPIPPAARLTSTTIM